MKKIFLALTLIAQLSARAESTTNQAGRVETKEDAAQAPASNAWKASANSYYYDMDGTRAANQNAYSFGNVHIFVENLELAYAISPSWKFFARAKYQNNDWDVIAGGKTYAETTSGLGDTLLGASHPLIAGPVFNLIADAGFFLPTGSIDEANAYIPGQHYKYFLQLGSGTVDETLALTSLVAVAPVKIGARASSILRNGHNADGYQAGNIFRADAWSDLPVGYGLTPRLVGYYRLVRPMNGADSKIDRAKTEFYYHDQIDWAVSAAFKFERAFTPNLAFNVEAGVPIFQGMQNSDNVVVSTKYFANLSLVGQF